MENQQVLITGATGNVGSAILQQLQTVDHQTAIRVATQNPQRDRATLATASDLVRFDFLDPSTFQPTFEGVERVFLVRPPQLGNVEKEIAPAVRAARAAGVRHIVFLSVQGVEQNQFIPHAKIEQLIRDEGFAYTFLRAGFFMQNLTQQHRDEIRKRHEIFVPVGDARTSFIDVADIGRVAAECLLSDEHENQIYTLTGPEALTYDEIAATLSEVLPYSVRYPRPNPVQYVWRHLRQGDSLGYTLVTTMLYTITRLGNAASVSDDVRAVTGKEPTSFRAFAQEHREAWI